jgi:peptidyl-prolyl cis-trans isomerase D
MFDLFRSRDKAVRYLLGGLLMLVALSMVITLIPGYGSNTGRSNRDETVLADVAGTKIDARDITMMLQRIARTGQIDPTMLEVYLPQFIEQKIQTQAAVYEADRMGLKVNDDEVLIGMQTIYQQFFQNGQLTNKDQLEQYVLQAQGHTLDEEWEAVRNQLLLRKLENVSLAGIVVTQKEVEDELRRKNEKAQVAYIAFAPAKFRADIKPTKEEIQAFFNTHRNDYFQPEKRTYQVLVIDQVKIEAGMTVSDAQLRQAYSSSMDSFRVPERVHARHILVMTTNKTDAEKKQLLTKAEDILKKVKGGADFAELAKKESDDKSSGEKGGDLDWVVRGQMVKPFEDATFALKPNEISGIVNTEYGYHIIQVLAKENARVKPFEEVKESLAESIKKQSVNDKMTSLAEQARAELAKAPANGEAIAKSLGLEVINVSKATPGSPVPTIGASSEIDGAVSSLQPNQVSQILQLPSNRLAVVEVSSKIPGRLSELDEAQDQVRDRIMTAKAEVVAADKAKQAAEKLKAGEDIQKVAKSFGLDVTTSIEFGHTDAVEGIGTADYVSDAFTKPVGTIIGPLPIQGRSLVVKVIAKKEADMSRLSGEREQIISSLRNKKSQARHELLLDSILARLTSEGKVKINRDAIKKLTASYRTR